LKPFNTESQTTCISSFSHICHTSITITHQISIKFGTILSRK